MSFDPFGPSEKPDYETLSQPERFEACRNTLMSRATGNGGDEGLYVFVRKEILAAPELKAKAPKFLATCRTLGDFWSFIKSEDPTYEGRRTLLREQFEPLLNFVESRDLHPAKTSADLALKTFDQVEIHDAWRRMLQRKDADPEAAITAARALVESVCKHVLEKLGKTYDDSAELPKLYRLTAEALNLAPDQHTEESFKRILGGCSSIVDGLANIRNRLSDAHGKGPRAVKPSPRHAELVVNVAGSMAAFLIATYADRTAHKPAA